MIVQPEIEMYIAGLVPARDEVLAEIEREASRRRIPIVGPAVGALLAVLVRLSQAKRMLTKRVATFNGQVLRITSLCTSETPWMD